jgi:uncharacterized delta-60 repeat protein
MGTLTLDKTFNLTGKLTDNIGGDDIVTDLVIQPDGKTIATGVKQSSSGVTDFYLRRYNRDGSPDSVFNNNASSTGGSTPSLSGSQGRDSRAIIQQGNFLYVIGNIVSDVSGSIPPEKQSKIFVAKYALDGVLQTSFGGGAAEGGQPGFSIFGAGLDDYEASSAVIQSDGKILVTGSVKRIASVNISGDQDVVLLRFTSNGVLDTAFGEVSGSQRSGKITLDIGVRDVANSVKMQRIGTEDRILIVGVTGESGSADFILARYTANGDLDTTFGSGGKITTNFGSPNASFSSDVARDVLVLNDNKILVVGSTDQSQSTGGQDFAIARYSADGLLDATFGQNGKLTINASSSLFGDDFAVKVIRDSSGKILVLGSAQNGSTDYDAALVRLNADGTLDGTFATNGVQLTDVGPGAAAETSLAVAISPQDSSVVIGGGSKASGGQTIPSDSFIVKYEGSLSPAAIGPDFNGDGRRDFIWRNRSQSDGRLVFWYMGGPTGTTFQSLAIVGTEPDQNQQIVSFADFNRDGKDDILWRNSVTGRSLVWFMNGQTKVGEKALNFNGSDLLLPGNDWNIKGTADFNRDGTVDILWRNKISGQNVVWNMAGSDGTTFSSLTEIGPAFTAGWDIRAVNDFNRDGNADLFWRNSVTGDNVIWYLGGPTGTEYQSVNTILGRPDVNWDVVGSGDFNKDGEADLLWRNNVGGQTQVWLLGGSSTITPKDSSYAVDALPLSVDWSLQATADFTGDGRPDFVWRNRSQSDGRLVFWGMGGPTGTTFQTLSIFGTETDQNMQIVSSADFDKDGKNDILWRNSITGRSLVWFMNGQTKVGEKALNFNGSDLLLPGNDWNIKGTADFNRDGTVDILWRNKISGQNVVWNMAGSDGTTFSSLTEIGPAFTASWDIRAVNDFNRDGNADLFWRNSVTGDNVIWYLGGLTGTEYQSVSSILGRPDVNWDVVGSGDFNKDGEADLLWRNNVGGQTQVWMLGGSSIITPKDSSYAVDPLYLPVDWQLL